MNNIRRIGAALTVAALTTTAVACRPADDNPSPTALDEATTAAPADTTVAGSVVTGTPDGFAGMSFTGTGDTVIQVQAALPTNDLIVHAAHDGASNFIVTPIVDAAQPAGAIVNVIGPYDGQVLLDPYGFTDTVPTMIQVQADGNWAINLLAVTAGVAWDGVTPLSAAGDKVVSVVAPTAAGPVTLTHDGARNFIVTPYDGQGVAGFGGLVNVIGQYTGETVMPAGVTYLQVQADGNWTFTPIAG